MYILYTCIYNIKNKQTDLSRKKDGVESTRERFLFSKVGIIKNLLESRDC